jgi:macrocin-O-methyltransferase TylF-like protien
MKPSELWRRVSSLDWLTSQAADAALHLHDSYSGAPFACLYRTVRPYTMSGNRRLRGLYAAVQRVVAGNVPGDVVECGTARGGSAALLGLALKEARAERTLWVFDTFAGIPPPTADDPDQPLAALYTGDFRGELGEVETLFRSLGILDRARLVKGLFQDTVPACEMETIAVLHLDGDWYESVKVCLDHLYDRVSRGGVIQIDDYGHWEGARKAVDEFMAARRLTVPLRYLDYTGRQFVKP